MINLKTVIGISVLLGSSFVPLSVAYAASQPQPGSRDGRVKSVLYMENDVVSVKGHYGFQTTIKFDDKERIENISIGDSEAWQVVPNKAKNMLFVKPILEKATTNMTVVTDKRLYNFELTSAFASSARSNELTYMLSFDYPRAFVKEFNGPGREAALGATDGVASGNATFTKTSLELSQVASAEPVSNSKVNYDRKQPFVVDPAARREDLNYEYGFTGNKDLSPSTVFDDGKFTYFQFPEGVSLPAIFEVNGKNDESLINMHKDGKYFVVEKLVRKFRLRDGKISACVYNNAFPVQITMFNKGET